MQTYTVQSNSYDIPGFSVSQSYTVEAAGDVEAVEKAQVMAGELHGDEVAAHFRAEVWLWRFKVIDAKGKVTRPSADIHRDMLANMVR